MKQAVRTTRKAAQPARKPSKRAKKSQGRLKVISKRLKKARVKFVKSARRKNKQLRKYFKKTFKKPSKTTRKAAQPARKHTKKPRGRFTIISRRLSKPGVYPLRLLFVSVVIAGGLGVFYGHQVWARDYSNLFGAGTVKQITEAPNRITTPGPSQTSPLFSIYPTWSQNFAADSSGKLNPQYWNIVQGIPQNDNHEAEYYTDNPANIHIKNGVLSLVATHQAEPNNYNYASARIDTSNKLSFLYGRIDVTAKVPNGIGTWPAVWFLPANTKYEDLSPPSDSTRYLNGGELDLLEEVGFNPNTAYGVVHTLSDSKNPEGLGTFNQVVVPNNEVNYNVYSLLWTPTNVTYEVNNVPFFTYNKPPGADYTTWAFDQPFYLILNLAVGGNWGGEDTAQFPGNGINNSALPASMDIQSIYYYPYITAQ